MGTIVQKTLALHMNDLISLCSQLQSETRPRAICELRRQIKDVYDTTTELCEYLGPEKFVYQNKLDELQTAIVILNRKYDAIIGSSVSRAWLEFIVWLVRNSWFGRLFASPKARNRRKMEEKRRHEAEECIRQQKAERRRQEEAERRRQEEAERLRKEREERARQERIRKEQEERARQERIRKEQEERARRERLKQEQAAKKQVNKYYEIFGLTPETLTEESLKQAYRKLCQKFHPDHNRSANADEKMAEINKIRQYLQYELDRKRQKAA